MEQPTHDWGQNRFSTQRIQPSSMLEWALVNWPSLGAGPAPRRALHVGCGTGRNAVYLARQGMEVVGFDSSEKALGLAAERLSRENLTTPPILTSLDLRQGIPAEYGLFDLVFDIFVYNEQVDPADRRRYREEVQKALDPAGFWLLGLPSHSDGFYTSCPDLEGASGDTLGENPRTVFDAEGELGIVLFSLQELLEEVGDRFTLAMFWEQRKQGMMYRNEYSRHNLVCLLRPKARD